MDQSSLNRRSVVTCPFFKVSSPKIPHDCFRRSSIPPSTSTPTSSRSRSLLSENSQNVLTAPLRPVCFCSQFNLEGRWRKTFSKCAHGGKRSCHFSPRRARGALSLHHRRCRECELFCERRIGVGIGGERGCRRSFCFFRHSSERRDAASHSAAQRGGACRGRARKDADFASWQRGDRAQEYLGERRGRGGAVGRRGESL